MFRSFELSQQDQLEAAAQLRHKARPQAHSTGTTNATNRRHTPLSVQNDVLRATEHLRGDSTQGDAFTALSERPDHQLLANMALYGNFLGRLAAVRSMERLRSLGYSDGEADTAIYNRFMRENFTGLLLAPLWLSDFTITGIDMGEMLRSGMSLQNLLVSNLRQLINHPRVQNRGACDIHFAFLIPCDDPAAQSPVVMVSMDETGNHRATLNGQYLGDLAAAELALQQAWMITTAMDIPVEPAHRSAAFQEQRDAVVSHMQPRDLVLAQYNLHCVRRRHDDEQLDLATAALQVHQVQAIVALMDDEHALTEDNLRQDRNLLRWVVNYQLETGIDLVHLSGRGTRTPTHILFEK